MPRGLISVLYRYYPWYRGGVSQVSTSIGQVFKEIGMDGLLGFIFVWTGILAANWDTQGFTVALTLSSAFRAFWGYCGVSGALTGFRGWGTPRPCPWPRPRLPAECRVPAGLTAASHSWQNKLHPRGPACGERKHCQSMHMHWTEGNLITHGAARAFDGCLSIVSDFWAVEGQGQLPAPSAWAGSLCVHADKMRVSVYFA